MPSRSTYINHHARTSRLRLVAVKTIFFHILIPLPTTTVCFHIGKYVISYLDSGGGGSTHQGRHVRPVGRCVSAYRGVAVFTAVTIPSKVKSTALVHLVYQLAYGAL